MTMTPISTPNAVIAPPFTLESATRKVRAAEDTWNSRDPDRVVLAYTEDSVWRNRIEFPVGRDQIRGFLAGKWQRELDYRLIKALWAFTADRIAVKFEYEWHDRDGHWFRSYGNELWEFDERGADAPPGSEHQRPPDRRGRSEVFLGRPRTPACRSPRDRVTRATPEEAAPRRAGDVRAGDHRDAPVRVDHPKAKGSSASIKEDRRFDTEILRQIHDLASGQIPFARQDLRDGRIRNAHVDGKFRLGNSAGVDEVAKHHSIADRRHWILISFVFLDDIREDGEIVSLAVVRGFLERSMNR